MVDLESGQRKKGRHQTAGDDHRADRELSGVLGAQQRAVGMIKERCLNLGVGLTVGVALATGLMAPTAFAQSLAVQAAQGKTQDLPSLNSGSGTSRQVQPVQVPTSPAPSASGDVVTDGSGGNVAELQRRIAAKELSELRTVYNGSYGASLLMANDDATYYVALFERKNFWRVIKTQSDTRAEAIFVDFARQTTDLSLSEIRSFKLEAQKREAEQLIALNQQRAMQIQADLAVAQTQQQAVDQRQQEAQAQASALDAENRQATAKLAELRRQIANLQREADAGLPPAASSSASSKTRRR